LGVLDPRKRLARTVGLGLGHDVAATLPVLGILEARVIRIKLGTELHGLLGKAIQIPELAREPRDLYSQATIVDAVLDKAPICEEGGAAVGLPLVPPEAVEVLAWPLVRMVTDEVLPSSSFTNVLSSSSALGSKSMKKS
jgi:hypothetical protein